MKAVLNRKPKMYDIVIIIVLVLVSLANSNPSFAIKLSDTNFSSYETVLTGKAEEIFECEIKENTNLSDLTTISLDLSKSQINFYSPIFYGLHRLSIQIDDNRSDLCDKVNTVVKKNNNSRIDIPIRVILNFDPISSELVETLEVNYEGFQFKSKISHSLYSRDDRNLTCSERLLHQARNAFQAYATNFLQSSEIPSQEKPTVKFNEATNMQTYVFTGYMGRAIYDVTLEIPKGSCVASSYNFSEKEIP